MKYICTIGPGNVLEIFTFPNTVNHDVMAEALRHLKDQTHGEWKRELRSPVSAAFVDNKGNCSGESETLGLESRPYEDTELLKMQE